MAFQINRRNGQNYAENLVDPILFFDSGTWTIVSGTGTSALNDTNYFVGSNSLKLENFTTTTPLVSSNSTQSTEIGKTTDYQLSWYLKKTNALQEVTGNVLIYKNAALLDTQTFSIGSTVADEDVNDVWQRFQADANFSFTDKDVITFQFTLNQLAAENAVLFIDGFMLNEANRSNIIVPFYTKPLNTDLKQAFGGYNYQDDGTSSVTTAVVDTWYLVPNNGGGALTTVVGGFSDVTPYNIATNNFDLAELNLYDDLELRIDVKVTTATTNQTVNFRLNIASEVATLNLFYKEYDVAVTDVQETIYMSVNVLTEVARTGGFTLEVLSDKVGAVITVNGYYIKVNKRLI
jgi:hypothetical protein